MNNNSEIVVIDNGSSRTYAGYGGCGEPFVNFQSYIGYAKYDEVLFGSGKDIYIGDYASENRAILILKYPIEHGIITNWDNMEKIWNFTFFNELRTDPAEHPVLITEPVKNPKINREKKIQIMFETFNVPSFNVEINGVLSLYASGRTTGITCDIGDGVSEIFPIYEGYPIPEAIVRRNFGGRELTEYLQGLLGEQGYYFTTSAEKEIVRDIKEKQGYVALDYESESQKFKTTKECDASYTLPDGNEIKISDLRFRCPELLFKPQLNGFEIDGIDKSIFDSIMKCHDDIRYDLYANIILSGGCTMFEGFPERIAKEISNLAPPKTKVNIIDSPERNISTWIGGSVLATLETTQAKFITKEQYNDSGPAIVHSKCFY